MFNYKIAALFAVLILVSAFINLNSAETSKYKASIGSADIVQMSSVEINNHPNPQIIFGAIFNAVGNAAKGVANAAAAAYDYVGGQKCSKSCSRRCSSDSW